MISRLEKLFFALLALFPFGMGAVYALINMTGGWSRFVKDRDYSFYLLNALESSHIAFALVTCAVLILVLCFLCKAPIFEKSSVRKVLFCVLAVFSLAFMLRLAFFLAYGSGIANTFDPGEAWVRAGGTLKGDDVRITDWGRYCPWWLYYSLLMKFFISVFGDRFDLFMALQTLFGGFTAAAVFLLGRTVSGSHRVGLLASLIYAVNPSGVVYYTACGNAEHIAIAFHVMAVLFAVVLLKETSLLSWGKLLVISSFAGVVVAVGDAFKPIFPIYAVAFAGVIFLKVVKTESTVRFAVLKRLLSSLVVIIAFRQIILSAFIMTTQSVFGIKAVMADAAPHSISVGLERGGEGQVFRSMTGVKYFKMRSDGVSRTDAAATVGREVLEGWYGHWDEIPSFFLKKSIWAWQDDCCAFYYFRYNRLRGGGVAKEKIDLLCEYGSHISLVMYFVVMLLAFGFAFSAALGRKSYGFGHLFCALVLVGFFMLLAISESAMRYKVVIMPYVFIYAACTLKTFLENSASCGD